MRIFVSYAREDRSEVGNVVADLRHLGHDVWFDEQLLGGTDWWAEILRRIRTAHVFVFALSPSAVASVACLSELEYANGTRRRLLPVMVRWTPPIALPGPLAHAQYVDYVTSGWKGLSSALVAMPPTSPLPDPLPPEPSLPELPLAKIRRRVLAPDPLTRGAQHELIDDIVRESHHAGQDAPAYDVLVALGDRADLYVDVSRRVQPALEEMWSRMPGADRSTRSGPWSNIARWSWGYVVGMCALALVTFGLVPLIIGWRNRDRPTRRAQSWVMVAAGVAYIVVFIVALIAGALSDTTT